ncbi:putative bifunctional diguanylate cyclase/phosphodiesterase [Granulosicoccus sp. 3-233]|uniref:putative bifunctional diguanylate cyclase/phosphodiesterase n=1 Tax=Granulosicoccus sp. 3-233 TaxID=3417969 RepID=UPI003D330476
MRKMEASSATVTRRGRHLASDETRGAEPSQSPLRSPLFWRITTVVFVCIVIIEAVLLIVSWFAERDRLLTRIDDSLALLSPILAVSDDHHELDSLLGRSGRSSQHPLIGYVLETSAGVERLGGDVAGLQAGLSASSGRVFNADSGVYDSALTLSQGDESLAMTLWYRVDARHVVDELQAYVFRIVGLVVLISLFVTVGCLLGLTPLLIRPLQTLDRLMVTGQRKGLRQITAPAALVARRDELGNVYRSFEQLTGALISAEDRNNTMRERFQGFADLGADSFWETDSRLRICYAAGDISGMFGISADELTGMSLRQLKQLLAGECCDADSIVPALKDQGVWDGQLQHPAESAGLRTVRIVARAMWDDDGRFRGARGTVVDTSVASELSAELKYQANHDTLTGLCNRREFARVLAREIEGQKSDGRQFCVCMLDLDRFKVVNDNCGHAAGDNLLLQLASLIQSTVREQDLVSRHGGDEFTVLLRGCGLEDGTRIAENIREAMNQFRFQWEERVYSVGVSIGIAECVAEMSGAETVILAADACCIKAKGLGRNQVQAYSSSDEVVARQTGEIQWVARISQALEDNRLLLYQQPIVNIGDKDDGEVHFEVLLRLQARDGTIHSPGEFLPAAERYGLVGQIDRWVVRNVIDWLEGLALPAQQRLCININLSGVTLSEESFQEFLLQTLAENRMLCSHLCFEITESAAMGNAGRTVAFLNELRKLGCRIAMDDFGTGFSSLSQVRQLPLDYIKIDGVFIQGIVESELDRALVRCVADVAGVLNVRTVAEVVESEAVYQVLQELGIDYAQGYLFGKPAPLMDVSLSSLLDDESAA